VLDAAAQLIKQFDYNAQADIVEFDNKDELKWENLSYC